jgi:nitrogen fixation protein FixH
MKTKQPDNETVIGFKADHDLITEIDKHAAVEDRTRSNMIKQLLRQALAQRAVAASPRPTTNIETVRESRETPRGRWSVPETINVKLTKPEPESRTIKVKLKSEEPTPQTIKVRVTQDVAELEAEADKLLAEMREMGVVDP